MQAIQLMRCASEVLHSHQGSEAIVQMTPALLKHCFLWTSSLLDIQHFTYRWQRQAEYLAAF